MMRRVTYLLLLFAAILTTAGEVSAQRYPERRMTREGNKLYYGGDFEGAELRYRRALEVSPELKEATFNLGNALLRAEKAEEAARVYSEIATDSLIDPNLASAANFNLGNVMLAGQKIDEAIEFYKQALRLNPTDAQAKYNLAYAQKLKQQQQEQQQDQDQDQDGDGQNDQNQDQNQNQNQDQNQDQNDQNGEQNPDKGDESESDGDDGTDKKNEEDGGEKPEPRAGQSEAKIDPETASQMLDAVQGEEDKTREKVNAKEVPAVGRSGKNW